MEPGTSASVELGHQCEYSVVMHHLKERTSEDLPSHVV